MADGDLAGSGVNAAAPVRAVEDLHRKYKQLTDQLRGVIVGMEDVIEQLLIAMLCNGHCILDLPYAEDSIAEVDMNIVMTTGNRFIEIQGTAESAPFTQDQNDKLLALGRAGCRRLMKIQRETLKQWEGEASLE